MQNIRLASDNTTLSLQNGNWTKGTR